MLELVMELNKGQHFQTCLCLWCLLSAPMPQGICVMGGSLTMLIFSVIVPILIHMLPKQARDLTFQSSQNKVRGLAWPSR